MFMSPVFSYLCLLFSNPVIQSDLSCFLSCFTFICCVNSMSFYHLFFLSLLYFLFFNLFFYMDWVVR